MPRIARILAFVIAGLTLLAAPGVAGAAIVNNGGFETGDFSGWQLADTDAGDWNVYSGTDANGFTVPAPPEGTHAAVTIQGEISRQILYQDVTLPAGATATQLSLLTYYIAEAPIFSPNTLSILGTNEQYRIDVMRPEAPLTSVAPGDVLTTVFRTLTGDPLSIGVTQKTADLSAYAGQTVRLRFAVATTEDELNAGVDAVSISSNEFTVGAPVKNKKKGTALLPVTVPGPGTLALTGTGVTPASATKAVAVGAGTTNLLVKATGKKKRKLKNKGKAKVDAFVSYAPTGLPGKTEQLNITLKKKRKK